MKNIIAGILSLIVVITVHVMVLKENDSARWMVLGLYGAPIGFLYFGIRELILNARAK